MKTAKATSKTAIKTRSQTAKAAQKTAKASAKAVHAKMQAKVLAPAATKTEFGKIANDVSEYDYDRLFGVYHTSTQMAAFLLELYDSDKTVGFVDRETFSFHLYEPQFQYAGSSRHNQKM